MDLFEFITVMISVILALAAAQIFLGIAPLLQTRQSVRLSATHGAWVMNLFVITFLHWWSLWDFRELSWTFPMFGLSLVGPSLMFFAATLINPHDVGREPVDLASHFRDIRRPFLAVFVVMMVFFTLDGPLFGTEVPFNRLRLAQVVIIGITGAGVFIRSDRVQLAISLVTLALVVLATTARVVPGIAL
ncbi:MAG: hypothetical protein HKN71_00280 [Gemmatimonadetes bacterium]|nr:hypothetical protein [Gemmatimonadota bacterium]